MTRKFVISGRVQNVGFRNYTSTCAYGLGVKGEVWNRKDGSVECIAQHEQEGVLDEFERRLYDGPGRVDRISSDKVGTETPYERFSITSGRGL
jgi:acylphosphatase